MAEKPKPPHGLKPEGLLRYPTSREYVESEMEEDRRAIQKERDRQAAVATAKAVRSVVKEFQANRTKLLADASRIRTNNKWPPLRCS